jgi:glutathione synthase
MSLDIALQMDPIESIDILGDSTFALALEAQSRGYKLFHYLPENLILKDGKVLALTQSLTLSRQDTNFFTKGKIHIMDLAEVDVVLMRQDPPFDMSYITTTHILEHIHPKTLVVNDPTSVRNSPEKLFVTHFKGLLPPTLITSNYNEIKNFRKEHQDIIIKPLYGNGGAGVFHIKPDDENLTALLEIFKTHYSEPIIAQRYLPEVRKGDKRIILVNGKPVGAINRVPAQGEARSNMHVGGTPLKTELTAREIDICNSIGPSLEELGLIFVGIDVIGDYLTEINVTSPTGIQEIDRFDGTNISSLIWNAIESKLK